MSGTESLADPLKITTNLGAVRTARIETAERAAKAVDRAAPGANERVDEPNVLADLGAGSHFRAIAAVNALRNAVRLNALFSVASGSICFVFAGWVGGQLGIGDSWTIIVRLVGFGLLAFAALLVVLAAAIPRRLIGAALPVVAGDASWVAATVVLIAMGSFSTRGAVVTGVVGVVVLGFAVLQWRARVGSLTAVGDATVRLDEMTTIEGVLFHREVPASVEALWPVMIDHELYAKLARNLGGATAVTENGPCLVRQCCHPSALTALTSALGLVLQNRRARSSGVDRFESRSRLGQVVSPRSCATCHAMGEGPCVVFDSTLSTPSRSPSKAASSEA